MNLDNFRSLCADANVTDQQILASIMDLKRVHGTFSDTEKDEVCAILTRSRRTDLAEKMCRNLSRRRKLP